MKLGIFNIFNSNKRNKINTIIIGYTTYYIIEIKENKELLLNKLVSKLFNLYIPLYWVGSYFEFETLFTYFKSESNIVFVLIF